MTISGTKVLQALGIPTNWEDVEIALKPPNVAQPDVVELAAAVQSAKRPSLPAMIPEIAAIPKGYEGGLHEAAKQRAADLIARVEKALPVVKSSLIGKVGLVRAAEELAAIASSLRAAAQKIEIDARRAAETSDNAVRQAQDEACEISRRRRWWGIFPRPARATRRAICRLIDTVGCSFSPCQSRALKASARQFLEDSAMRLEQEQPGMIAQIERLLSVEAESGRSLAEPAPTPPTGEICPPITHIDHKTKTLLKDHGPAAHHRIAEALAQGDTGEIVAVEAERILNTEPIVPDSVLAAWKLAGLNETIGSTRMLDRAAELAVKDRLVAPGGRVRRAVTLVGKGVTTPDDPIRQALDRVVSGDARLIPVECSDPLTLTVSIEEHALAAQEIREIEKAVALVRRDPSALRPFLLLTDNAEAVLRAFGNVDYAPEKLAILLAAEVVVPDTRGGWWRFSKDGHPIAQGIEAVLAALAVPSGQLAHAHHEAEAFLSRAGSDVIAQKVEKIIGARPSWMTPEIQNALERLRKEAGDGQPALAARRPRTDGQVASVGKSTSEDPGDTRLADHTIRRPSGSGRLIGRSAHTASGPDAKSKGSAKNKRDNGNGQTVSNDAALAAGRIKDV